MTVEGLVDLYLVIIGMAVLVVGIVKVRTPGAIFWIFIGAAMVVWGLDVGILQGAKPGWSVDMAERHSPKASP